MAAKVQSAVNSSTVAAAALTATFPGSTTSGNTIGLIFRCTASAESVVSVSDGTNTYTLAVSDTTQDPHMYAYYAKNITGTSTGITVTLSTPIAFFWVYAIEFSGCDTTAPLDANQAKTGTSVTDLVSNAFSTNGSGAVMLGVGQNNFATYTAGTNYTLDNGSIGTGPYGGIEYRLPGSALSSEVQHITSNVTNQYTIVIMAFKDASGGGSTNWGPWIISNNWNRLVQ